MREYGSIEPAVAADLLKRYMPIAGAIAAALYRGYERDELLQHARIAILDAYLEYDPSRAKLTTWVRRNIHWAFAQYAQSRRRDDINERAERTGTDPQLLNGADPEEQFWRATAVRAMSVLTPRRRFILSERMKHTPLREIAHTLGLSHQRVHQEDQAARRQLRELLSAPGANYEGPLPPS